MSGLADTKTTQSSPVPLPSGPKADAPNPVGDTKESPPVLAVIPLSLQPSHRPIWVRLEVASYNEEWAKRLLKLLLGSTGEVIWMRKGDRFRSADIHISDAWQKLLRPVGGPTPTTNHPYTIFINDAFVVDESGQNQFEQQLRNGNLVIDGCWDIQSDVELFGVEVPGLLLFVPPLLRAHSNDPPRAAVFPSKDMRLAAFQPVTTGFPTAWAPAERKSKGLTSTSTKMDRLSMYPSWSSGRPYTDESAIRWSHRLFPKDVSIWSRSDFRWELWEDEYGGKTEDPSWDDRSHSIRIWTTSLEERLFQQRMDRFCKREALWKRLDLKTPRIPPIEEWFGKERLEGLSKQLLLAPPTLSSGDAQLLRTLCSLDPSRFAKDIGPAAYACLQDRHLSLEDRQFWMRMGILHDKLDDDDDPWPLTFTLNLDSDLTRRAEAMEQWVGALRERWIGRVLRWSATDGRDEKSVEGIRAWLKSKGPIMFAEPHLSGGELGCWASNLRFWIGIVEGGKAKPMTTDAPCHPPERSVFFPSRVSASWDTNAAPEAAFSTIVPLNPGSEPVPEEEEWYIQTEDDMLAGPVTWSHTPLVIKWVRRSKCADLVWLGYHTQPQIRGLRMIDRTRESSVPVPMASFPEAKRIGGTFAYAISRAGARKLLEHIASKEVGRVGQLGVDSWMMNMGATVTRQWVCPRPIMWSTLENKSAIIHTVHTGKV